MRAELDFAKWGPRDYVRLPEMPDSWHVCDIGPGQYPLRRANVFIDKHQEILDAIELEQGQQALLGDLEKGLPEVPSGYFDFCYVSHVLEHLVELQTAIATLNRIAKRGTMVVPSFAKDSLVFFEEREHFWHCLPNPTHGKPVIFVEHNHGFVERLRDSTMQKAMCFLLRTGTHHDCTTERYMRGWFQQHESDLDIVHSWGPDNPLEAVIIR